MKSTIEMLEGALSSVNESIAVTCKKLDALHDELKKTGTGMSVTESFLNAGKQFLMATENLKRLDEKMSRLADDITGINMRLVRVETLISVEGTPSQAGHRRRSRTLPGETS